MDAVTNETSSPRKPVPLGTPYAVSPPYSSSSASLAMWPYVKAKPSPPVPPPTKISKLTSQSYSSCCGGAKCERTHPAFSIVYRGVFGLVLGGLSVGITLLVSLSTPPSTRAPPSSSSSGGVALNHVSSATRYGVGRTASMRGATHVISLPLEWFACTMVPSPKRQRSVQRSRKPAPLSVTTAPP